MTEVTASRDGLIREIKVAVGDTVKKNQEILIIDSPELTTLILAAEAGVVEIISVNTGEWIKTGQLLAWIESGSK